MRCRFWDRWGAFVNVSLHEAFAYEDFICAVLGRITMCCVAQYISGVVKWTYLVPMRLN